MPYKFSVIVPVFNRPIEVEELLTSLTLQSFKDFEVIIVEDGSSVSSRDVVAKFESQLALQYFFKLNSGPGPSRNFGFEKALGDYFVIFDSDCIIPPDYFQIVDHTLAQTPLDAWGGPDRGSRGFSDIQRAMAYTMSSTLTTGGIRGGAKKGFQPRSFNMGISRAVFERTKGFQLDRLAEDIELSIRMKKEGFNVQLIPGAFVYHKRRTNLAQFFRQVSGFGKGRVQVGRVHAGAVKIAHWFPAAFFVGLFVLPFLLLISVAWFAIGVAGYGVYLLAIGIDAWITTGSVTVAMLSVPAAFVQMVGYGSGFLKEMFRTGI